MMKRILAWTLLALLAFSCGKEPVNEPAQTPEDEKPVVEPVTEKTQPGTYVLPLLETTDIHGYLVDSENGTVHYRMAFLADKVKDIRGRGDQYHPERLLLLDGGDLYQGASISNLLSGAPLCTAMDLMDYDAVALGNHEFDWGIENTVDADATMPDYDWEGTRHENRVPVLCANLYQNVSRVPFTKDYTILEKTAFNAQGETVPVKIGVVGFAVNYASSIMTAKFTGRGYTIVEDYAMANQMAADLEASGQCDATLFLIHGAANAAAEKLGQGSAFDLVLGGHSHAYQAGVTDWGMQYLQGGRYCERAAYALLKFNVDQEGSVSFTGIENQKILSINPNKDQHTAPGQNAEDLDDDLLAVSDNALAAISQQLEDLIGYINVDATTNSLAGSGGRAAPISNWMCDITRRIGEADVAFVNSGGIRTSIPLNGQPTRNITVADVFEMFPFDNTIYVYEITYADLLQVFEYAMTAGGESLFARMTGIDCYFLQGFPEMLSLKKDGTVIYQKGTWTGNWASRTLTLAVSEYLATSQRVDYKTGIGNPLIEWNSTPRLVSNDQVDNVSAVRVLREEAAASGGLLSIDTTPHFLMLME